MFNVCLLQATVNQFLNFLLAIQIDLLLDEPLGKVDWWRLPSREKNGKSTRRLLKICGKGTEVSTDFRYLGVLLTPMFTFRGIRNIFIR